MNTYSATDLALEWLAQGRPVEHTSPDGSSLMLYTTIDLDYRMAYLLRVGGTRDCPTVSWLAVYQRHAPQPYDPTGLLVEWLNEGAAEAFFDQDHWRAMERFVEWTRQVDACSF